jgi:hypothetical protein
VVVSLTLPPTPETAGFVALVIAAGLGPVPAGLALFGILVIVNLLSLREQGPEGPTEARRAPESPDPAPEPARRGGARGGRGDP